MRGIVYQFYPKIRRSTLDTSGDTSNLRQLTIIHQPLNKRAIGMKLTISDPAFRNLRAIAPVLYLVGDKIDINRALAAEGLTNQTFLQSNLMGKNISLHMEESVNKLDNLNSEIRFTREEQLYIYEHFEPVKLQKNEFLLREGEIEKYFYFVEGGILRYWTTDGEDREITIRFAMEGEFAGAYLSLKTEEPSSFHIQAIEEVVIWRITQKKLSGAYSWSLNINKAIRLFFEDLHCRQTYRDICMLRLSAEDRYRHLLQQEKEILLSVPLKYIASYIGIAPQTLSRVRRTAI